MRPQDGYVTTCSNALVPSPVHPVPSPAQLSPQQTSGPPGSTLVSAVLPTVPDAAPSVPMATVRRLAPVNPVPFSHSLTRLVCFCTVFPLFSLTRSPAVLLAVSLRTTTVTLTMLETNVRKRAPHSAGDGDACRRLTPFVFSCFVLF